MNRRLADIKEKAQRKEELLAQLSTRLSSITAERVEKDKLKERLNNKLSVRMGLKAPSETLRIQHDKTVGST